MPGNTSVVAGCQMCYDTGRNQRSTSGCVPTSYGRNEWDGRSQFFCLINVLSVAHVGFLLMPVVCGHPRRIN